MAQRVRVAAGQSAPVPGRPEKNAEQVAELAAGAAAMGAQFILCPETIITGCDDQAMDLRPTGIPLDHPALQLLQDAARQHAIAICAGLVEKVPQGCYITQAVALADGSLAFQRKGCVSNQEGWMHDDERTIIEVGALRVGLIICADSSRPDLYDKVMRGGANLICHPSAGSDWAVSESDQADEAKVHEVSAHMFGCIRNGQGRARELGVAYLVSNPIGASGTVYWPGNSGIIGRDGTVRAWLPGEIFIERMAPAFVVAEVEVGG